MKRSADRIDRLIATYKTRDPMVLAHLAGQEVGRHEGRWLAFTCGVTCGALLNPLIWWLT